MDFSLDHLYFASLVLLGFLSVILLLYMVLKQNLSKDRFFRFLAILAINIACTLLPLGFFSVIFGLPAAFCSAVLITSLLDKEGKK
jgi:hypothetical protein